MVIRSRRRAWRPDDRGAVAVMCALLVPVLVVVAALVVDLGMQRIARTDMQSLADVVALDLSRQLDGRTVAELAGSTPTLEALADASRDRNPGTIGETPSMDLELGEIGSDGRFVELTAATARPTAVRVTASTEVAFAFVSGTGGTSRSAVAAATSFACYKIGSWAAVVDTRRSVLLDPLLRQMAQQSGAFANGGTVGALTYTGLAQTRIDLNELALALGLASVDDLARATVSARALLAAAHVAARPRPSTAVTMLGTLAANATASMSVQVGRLLAADLGSGSLVGATTNALDLVGGTISLLNGSRVANVYLGATLPSLSSAGLTAQVVQGPRQYCGRPRSPSTTGVARDTQQLTARAAGQLAPTTLDFLPPLVPGLLSSVASGRIIAENYATFDVGVAGTSSSLAAVRCGRVQGIDLEVENGLATLKVSTPLRAEVRARLATLTPLGLPSLVDAVIRVNAGVNVTAVIGAGGRVPVSISVPPQELDKPYPTGDAGITITAVTRTYGNVDAHVALLGGALGANVALSPAQQTQLLDAILSSGMQALLGPGAPHNLAATVVEPLLGLVGARAGGSDVILDSTPALGCSQPRLVG